MQRFEIRDASAAETLLAGEIADSGYIASAPQLLSMTQREPSTVHAVLLEVLELAQRDEQEFKHALKVRQRSRAAPRRRCSSAASCCLVLPALLWQSAPLNLTSSRCFPPPLPLLPHHASAARRSATAVRVGVLRR